MARKKAPELNFQKHIADFLVREHKYGLLNSGDIIPISLTRTGATGICRLSFGGVYLEGSRTAQDRL